MIRFKLFLDFSKEEKWLADMARQGWELDKVHFGYSFHETAPQEQAVYRIDYRMFSSRDEFKNYTALFEDSGWQHIAGSPNSGAQYFKRITPDSTEDIFSDAFSRAGRYQRFSHLWLVMAATFLGTLETISISGGADLRALVQPARFYLTPGLWERTGEAFWEAFLYETPFALFRAGMLYSFPIAIALYLGFAIKSKRLYQKEKNNVMEA